MKPEDVRDMVDQLLDLICSLKQKEKAYYEFVELRGEVRARIKHGITFDLMGDEDEIDYLYRRLWECSVEEE